MESNSPINPHVCIGCSATNAAMAFPGTCVDCVKKAVIAMGQAPPPTQADNQLPVPRPTTPTPAPSVAQTGSRFQGRNSQLQAKAQAFAHRSPVASRRPGTAPQYHPTAPPNPRPRSPDPAPPQAHFTGNLARESRTASFASNTTGQSTARGGRGRGRRGTDGLPRSMLVSCGMLVFFGGTCQKERPAMLTATAISPHDPEAYNDLVETLQQRFLRKKLNLRDAANRIFIQEMLPFTHLGTPDGIFGQAEFLQVLSSRQGKKIYLCVDLMEYDTALQRAEDEQASRHGDDESVTIQGDSATSATHHRRRRHTFADSSHQVSDAPVSTGSTAVPISLEDHCEAIEGIGRFGEPRVVTVIAPPEAIGWSAGHRLVLDTDGFTFKVNLGWFKVDRQALIAEGAIRKVYAAEILEPPSVHLMVAKEYRLESVPTTLTTPAADARVSAAVSELLSNFVPALLSCRRLNPEIRRIAKDLRVADNFVLYQEEQNEAGEAIFAFINDHGPTQDGYGPRRVYHFEERLEGRFTTWRANQHFSPVANLGACPMSYIMDAFIHWTYLKSQGRMVVCDLKGVGTTLSGPQIIDRDENMEWGIGNTRGPGVARFEQQHLCGRVCTAMNLGPLDAIPWEHPPIIDRSLDPYALAPSRPYSLKARYAGLADLPTLDQVLDAATNERLQFASTLCAQGVPIPQAAQLCGGVEGGAPGSALPTGQPLRASAHASGSGTLRVDSSSAAASGSGIDPVGGTSSASQPISLDLGAEAGISEG